MRNASHLPLLICLCPQATDRGLSHMVDRLVEDVEGLLAEPLEVVNINSTRLAYIMTIGPVSGGQGEPGRRGQGAGHAAQ